MSCNLNVFYNFIISFTLRSRYSSHFSFDSRAKCKRMLFMSVIGIIVLMTAFTVLGRVFEQPSDNDPAFNPRANPNIRIAAVPDIRLN